MTEHVVAYSSCDYVHVHSFLRHGESHHFKLSSELAVEVPKLHTKLLAIYLIHTYNACWASEWCKKSEKIE